MAPPPRCTKISCPDCDRLMGRAFEKTWTKRKAGMTNSSVCRSCLENARPNPSRKRLATRLRSAARDFERIRVDDIAGFAAKII